VRKWIYLPSIASIWATSARACPLCHSDTAEVLRAGLAATSTDISVLAALVLPFLGVGLAVRLGNRLFSDKPSGGLP
jgi:hypothetical protein